MQLLLSFYFFFSVIACRLTYWTKKSNGNNWKLRKISIGSQQHRHHTAEDRSVHCKQCCTAHMLCRHSTYTHVHRTYTESIKHTCTHNHAINQSHCLRTARTLYSLSRNRIWKRQHTHNTHSSSAENLMEKYYLIESSRNIFTFNWFRLLAMHCSMDRIKSQMSIEYALIHRRNIIVVVGCGGGR